MSVEDCRRLLALLDEYGFKTLLRAISLEAENRECPTIAQRLRDIWPRYSVTVPDSTAVAE